ncbi:hypothetical protein THAOC_03161, partial [Thalassiosira oceanica]
FSKIPDVPLPNFVEFKTSNTTKGKPPVRLGHELDGEVMSFVVKGQGRPRDPPTALTVIGNAVGGGRPGIPAEGYSITEPTFMKLSDANTSSHKPWPAVDLGSRTSEPLIKPLLRTNRLATKVAR